MSKNQRILICALILVLDLVVFFLPLTAIFLVYIILHNPPGSENFCNNLITRIPRLRFEIAAAKIILLTGINGIQRETVSGLVF